MNVGDFHGLDYNDYHCDRNLLIVCTLKLHYILVPNEYVDNTSEKYRRLTKINGHMSREFMRMSAHPNNIIEYVMDF
jgi:hypothetical protein